MDDKILLRNNKIAIALHSDKLTKMSEGATLMEIEKDNIGITDFLNSEDACSYISDFQKDSYHFLNRSFLHFTGFDKQHIKDIGLSFLQFIIYKDDVKGYLAICTLWYAYLLTLPLDERTKATAFIQFRTVSSSGEIIWVIKQLRILICDCNGAPAAEMGTFKNNSPFKTDTIVSGYAVNNGIIIRFDHLSLLPKQHIFAPRQVELIECVSWGCHNKDIVEKMGTTISTVRSSRAKILDDYKKHFYPDETSNRKMQEVINYMNNLGVLKPKPADDLLDEEI